MNKQVIWFIKMSLGSVLSILIALFFNLSYAITAGVVSILSLEQTKKKSLEVAYKRIVISLFGLIVSSILYAVFNYEWVSLFLSIVLIVSFGLFFKLREGIVVSVVLISHAFVEKSLSYQTNALFILLIGVFVALVLNLFMPNNEERLKKEIKAIDEMVRVLINDLIDNVALSFELIEKTIEEALKDLTIDIENQFFSRGDYKIAYLQMRLSQVEHLKSIERLRLGANSKEAPIDHFLLQLKQNIGLENKATPLLEELRELETTYRKKELPKTREEFEQRAYMYLVIVELKSFLNQKIIFHQTFPKV